MTTIEEIYSLYHSLPGISTDSRNVIPGSLFFAIKGENFDGNRFASDALEKGASFAVTDDPGVIRDDRFILVNDTLDTLQKLATYHRHRMKAEIIGITGTNGKTTTKELIGRVLSSTFNTIITQGNLNNHIGVPMTILSIKEDTDFAVVEMGANHAGEIAGLCAITRPDYGIITNIGKAHLAGFGSYEGVIRAKSELYNFIRQTGGTIFLNLDNQILVNLANDIKAFTYGKSDRADCKGEITSRDPFLSVKWSDHAQSGIIKTNLYGDYNLENILAAICIGLYFRIPPEKIDSSVSSYIPDNNRSQWLNTGKNILVLDAYNANPSSMKAALTNFQRLESREKLVILGDMMELGRDSLAEHQNVIDLAAKLSLRNLVVIGEQFGKAYKAPGIIYFRNIREADSWFQLNPVTNNTILIKGSRKMQLEKLANLF